MLETHRLKLVKPNLSYTDELYQLHTNKVATKHTPKGIHQNKVATQDFIKGWMRHWDEYQFGYFILIMRDNHEVVGIAGFEYRTIHQQQFLNAYYRIFPSYTGVGLAFESMEEIARHLKKHDTITPKLIRTNQYNTNSIKLAQKLGYNYDANWDDVINKGDRCFFNLQTLDNN